MKLFCERVLVSASNRSGTGRIMYQNSVKKRSEKQRDVGGFIKIFESRAQYFLLPCNLLRTMPGYCKSGNTVQCISKVGKIKGQRSSGSWYDKLVARSATGTP